MRRLTAQLKSNAKILLMLSAVVLITAALGVTTLFTLDAFDQRSEVLYEKDLVGLAKVKETNVNLILMGRSLRQMMVAPNREVSRSLGAEGFLMKPLDPTTVVETVQRTIG